MAKSSSVHLGIKGFIELEKLAFGGSFKEIDKIHSSEIHVVCCVEPVVRESFFHEVLYCFLYWYIGKQGREVADLKFTNFVCNFEGYRFMDGSFSFASSHFARA